MRRIALLLAAALIVSAPLVASVPTDSYAAAKKASKGGKAKGKEEKKIDPNMAFGAALSDLFASLGKPSAPAESGKKGAKAGKKAKKG